MRSEQQRQKMIAKRIDRAIDAMIDLQDLSAGCGTVEEILTRLRELYHLSKD